MSHYDWDGLIRAQDEITGFLSRVMSPEEQDDLRESQRGRVLASKADAVRLTIAQTNGYIMALEDMLKDLSLMSYDQYTLDRVREIVTRSLIKAQETLGTLLGLQEETT